MTTISHPLHSPIKSPGVLRFGGPTLPRTGLIWYAKAPGLVDSIGLSSGPPQPGRGYTCAGGEWIDLPHLTGSETITSKQGTATATLWPGQIALGAGTIWDIQVSDGSHFPCAEGAGLAVINTNDPTESGIISSNAVHAEFSDGTGYNLNIDGFSDRENCAAYSSTLTGAAWVKNAGTVTQSGDYWLVAPQSGFWLIENNMSGLESGEIYTIRVTLKCVTDPERTLIDILDSGYSSIASSEYQNFPSINIDSVLSVDCTAPANGIIHARLSKANDATTRLVKSIHVCKKIGRGIYANGDSTCQGSFGPVSISAYTSHSHLLAQLLNCDIANNSTGGETLAQILTDMQTDLASTTYPIGVVGGGYNSIIGQASSPVAAMLSIASDIIDLGIAQCSVFVMTSVNSYSLSGDERTWAIAYNSGLSSLCGSKGAVFVDVETVLSANEAIIASMYTLDTMHYNEYGAQEVAELIESLITVPSDLPTFQYIETQKYPAFGPQPAASATLDCFGNSLQYPGPIKLSIQGPDGAYYWPSDPRTLARTGVDNAVYDASGVGKTFATKAMALAAMATLADDTYLFAGAKAAALYSVDMSAQADRIKRIVGD
jgi:hypothetical protein